MAVTNETRKRLWGQSANRCAKCRTELVRDDVDEHQGALVGQEAHIVARSPGGPRYAALEVAERDGYANLILLCANDHIEVDALPGRYTVQVLQELKHAHEQWVRERLRPEASQDGSTCVAATVQSSGGSLWDLLSGCLGYDFAGPDDLTDPEADLVDGALQNFRDWGEIESEITAQGFRAVRHAYRSLQGQLDELAGAGLVVLGGQTQGKWLGGQVVGAVAVLRVIRVDDLADHRGTDGLRQ